LAKRSSSPKLNIDDHPNAPAKYGVRGIPTMILFKNGEVADTKVGAAPKSALKGWLEGALLTPIPVIVRREVDAAIVKLSAIAQGGISLRSQ
jgi:thioredoxin-like negative regulator of GroEL